MFIYQARTYRYRVVHFHALNLGDHTSSIGDALDLNYMVPLLQGWQLPLSLATRTLPYEQLAASSQKFFLGLNFIQLNLWANGLLADDPLSFGTLVRMD